MVLATLNIDTDGTNYGAELECSFHQDKIIWVIACERVRASLYHARRES